jgi:hypothetical protein
VFHHRKKKEDGKVRRVGTYLLSVNFAKNSARQSAHNFKLRDWSCAYPKITVGFDFSDLFHSGEEKR